MFDQKPEDTAAGGQVADGIHRRRVHAHVDEFTHPSIDADDAESAVASIREVDSGLHNPAKCGFQLQTGSHGNDCLEEASIALAMLSHRAILPQVRRGRNGAILQHMTSKRAIGRVAAVAVTLVAVSMAPGTAQAHQPVALTAADSTPKSGPLLVDGSVSFAVNAKVKRGTTRGFRMRLPKGARLAVQLLIYDRSPANTLPASQLPQVTVKGPGGMTTVLRPNERTPFYEPYGGTSYLFLSRLSRSAKPGTYRITVSGQSSTKIPVVVAVGYREVPGRVID